MAYVTVVFALSLVGIRWWDFYVKQTAIELIVYNVGKGKAVDYFYKGQLYYLTEGVSDSDVSFKISPNRIQHGIPHGKPLAWKELDEDLYVVLPDKGAVRIPHQHEELFAQMEYFQAGQWRGFDSQSGQEFPSSHALRYITK